MINLMKKIRETLSTCSTLELAIEVIEEGNAVAIDGLREYEPIPMDLLLEEASRRFARPIESRKQFIEIVLLPDFGLDKDIRTTLKHMIKIKEIEGNFRQN